MASKFVTMRLVDIPEHLQAQMFQQRKSVFCDKLRWDLEPIGEFEKDEFDDNDSEYFLWLDQTETKLLGSIRLRSMLNKTLLQSVFTKTYEESDFKEDSKRAGGIEGTRLCFNYANIKSCFGVTRLCFAFFLSGLFEICYAKEADYLVANFDEIVERRCQSMGLRFEIMGENDSYGERPVKCGQFPISIENFAAIHRHLEMKEAA